MKNSKKVIALILAAVSSLSVTMMAACQEPEPDTPSINEKPEDLDSVSTISVGIFNGGLGYEWAEHVAADFAEYYKDYSFEEGKTGVYVDVLKSKELYAGTTLHSRVENKLENVDMYYTPDSVSSISDISADITDIVTEKVYDNNGNIAPERQGTKAIVDFLADYYVDQYNLGTEENPKYKYLPYEDCLTGFVYDYELFSENGWLNYSGLDGTPKYTDEFIDLLDRIVAAGYIPWTTSMDTSWYPEDFYQGFLMQYEGEEKALMNLTLNGEYTFPAGTLSDEIVEAENVVVNADGTQTVQITEENAWLLVYQPGKKELLQFCYDVTRPQYLSSNVNGATNSFTECQKNFVMSWGYDKGGMTGGQRIAMLYEGEWWEHEAKSSFDDLARRYPGNNLEYGKRDFRMMTIPQVRGAANEYEYSMYIGGGTGEFVSINSDPAKRDIVKKWLQFTKSRQGLVTHAQYTSMVLPYEFEMQESEMNNWSKFAKSLARLKRSEDVHIYRATKQDNYVSIFEKTSSLPMSGVGWSTLTKNGSANDASYFHRYIKNPNLSVTSLYNSMFTIYTKEAWSVQYQKYADRYLK